jgi:acyl-coenzyme A synthetase/AMP-(fatty) acid ligase
MGFRDRDGNFHLIGRVDDQVKVQGYRIELGEVTHAVESCDSVLAACTLCVAIDGVSALVVFVEPADDCVTERVIVSEAKRRLPTYMMPSRFVIMDSLPRTDRGKIDKAELAQSLQGSPDEVAAIS